MKVDLTVDELKRLSSLVWIELECMCSDKFGCELDRLSPDFSEELAKYAVLSEKLAVAYQKTKKEKKK